MKKTPLQRKTPLQAKTTLKVRAPLKAKTPLKANTALSQKQKGARKLKTPYFSVFTKDMHRCIITGDTDNVDPHHIFSGGRKTFSEKYGFMIPLRRDWHETANYSIHKDRNLELQWKIKCQNYWINELHRTKEEWISECGMWWMEKAA